MKQLHTSLEAAVAEHGSEAVIRALESAGLFRGLSDQGQHAVGVANDALTCGIIPGTLVFNFAGLPEDAVVVTYMTGGAELVVTADT